jgi:hypothetical protein
MPMRSLLAVGTAIARLCRIILYEDLARVYRAGALPALDCRRDEGRAQGFFRGGGRGRRGLALPGMCMTYQSRQAKRRVLTIFIRHLPGIRVDV